MTGMTGFDVEGGIAPFAALGATVFWTHLMSRALIRTSPDMVMIVPVEKRLLVMVWLGIDAQKRQG